MRCIKGLQYAQLRETFNFKVNHVKTKYFYQHLSNKIASNVITTQSNEPLVQLIVLEI